MAYSGGLTGKISSVMTQAAELAIRRKTEAISLQLGQPAYLERLIGPRAGRVASRYRLGVDELV